MPRRFDLGRAVLVAGATLLFISLFLEWYDTSQTGWEVFEALDLALAGLALAGIATALRPELTPPWTAWAVPLAAVVIVVVQLIDAPPAASPDAGPAGGAWVALAGSLLMAAGSSLSLTSVSVIVQVRDRDVRRRVAAVDRRADGEDAAAAIVAPEEVQEAAAEGRGPRGGRFRPAASPAAASDDIERTQPLSAIDEEPAEGAERP
jgi:hypothetical protein